MYRILTPSREFLFYLKKKKVEIKRFMNFVHQIRNEEWKATLVQVHAPVWSTGCDFWSLTVLPRTAISHTKMFSNSKDSPAETLRLSDIIFHRQSASDLSEQQATPPTLPKVRTRQGVRFIWRVGALLAGAPQRGAQIRAHSEHKHGRNARIMNKIMRLDFK